MPFGMSRVLVSDVEAIRDILERRRVHLTVLKWPS